MGDRLFGHCFRFGNCFQFGHRSLFVMARSLFVSLKGVFQGHQSISVSII
ncbi:MAG: hypothetical protein F6K09_07035 [Merismopedia sp. SIO2A8]|nr:hypothetical protein [Merismopedia sp. SIO2A8]